MDLSSLISISMEHVHAGRITHRFGILRLHYEENAPCEQACTTALLFRRMSTERPIESGCILRQRNVGRFQSRQLGDEVLQHWLQLHVQLPTWSQQFLHCSSPTGKELMQMERKGIQIISSALKMRRQPKSNPWEDTDTHRRAASSFCRYTYTYHTSN